MKDTHPTNNYEVLRPLEIPVIARRHIKDLGLGAQRVETDHAFLLSSLIQQARRFYEAAGKTPIHVRPLLVYYGMLHLAKAVVLLRDPDAITTVESQKHGIATPRTRRAQPYWRQKVCIQPNGVFPSCLRSVISEYRDPEPSPIPYKEPLPLSSLWACLPDIENMSAALDIVPRWTRLTVADASGQWLIPHGWAGRCGLTEEEVTVALGRWHHNGWYEGARGKKRAREGDETTPDRSSHPWLNLSRGPDRYATIPPYAAPIAATAILPEAFVICLILFHASMLVRYDAETWTDLVGDSRAPEHWMFEQLCHTATVCTPPYFAGLLGLSPD